LRRIHLAGQFGTDQPLVGDLHQQRREAVRIIQGVVARLL
jgi:hypothetical protein